MFRHLTEQIIKKDLHTAYVSELIPCHGYRYLSILTDGAFNPNPFPTGMATLNHYVILKNSNRLIPIYGEMRNIPLGKNAEIRYTSEVANIVAGEVQNGYGNIIFYLSNYPNDFMSIKGNIGFQWEDSFQVLAETEKSYHFGIDRQNASHILVIPFIANCFNKLVYLFKEDSASTNADFEFIHKDNNINTIALVTDTLTEVLLPCHRFRIYLKTGVSAIDFDIMLKFEKA